AMKAREAQRLSAIRLLLAAIKQREVDERKELSDAEVVAVIEKMIKQRRDSITQFQAANRKDLVDGETFELNLLSGYLPKQLTDAEIGEEVSAAIDRKSTRLNSSHRTISYAVFCLKKKNMKHDSGSADIDVR